MLKVFPPHDHPHAPPLLRQVHEIHKPPTAAVRDGISDITTNHRTLRLRPPISRSAFCCFVADILPFCVINDEDLLKILELPILVVLDEAYIEFSGIDSKMKWVKKHENLIVLRTFSKRAALAGLRVGYGAFPLSIIQYLWRAKQPYNVSVAAEISACAALKNSAYLEEVKVALVQERQRLFGLLKELPFINPYPSYSNFILCEVTSGMDAKKLKEDLANMGVMIRHYNNKELKGYVRISVGKPEQTDALMKCLNSLLLS